MEIIFFVVLSILVMSAIYKHNNLKKYEKKVSEMTIGQKQLEISKIQIQMAECKTNHVLHFLISFVTLGCWIIIWMFIAHFNTKKRNSLEGMLARIN